MINYNAALPAGNYPASKSSINVTDWIQGIKGNLSYLIRQAFRGGEVGFAYDPNDLTTLYQDIMGTIPVTASGQPVGLMLDKSKGLLRREELLVNGDFSSNVSWSIYENMSFSEGKLKANSTTNASVAQTAFKAVVGKCYELTVNLSAYTKGPALVQLGGQYINFAAAGIHKRLVIATTATSSLEIIAGYFGSGGLWEMDSISVREVYGNHAYQTDSACKPKLQRNATTGAYYLEFDGSDDFLQTSNIDFTATNKVSLFAGIVKLINSQPYSCVMELSASIPSSNGVFNLVTAGVSNGDGFLFENKGTTLRSVTVIANPVPYRAVIAQKGDIVGGSTQLKLNGNLAPINAGSLGTGNYGNYPLYIGRRGGTSIPFNGHLYSLIGIGRLTTDAETIALEKSIAKNTGVTLSV